MSTRVSFLVGNERWVKFWKNKWYRDNMLGVFFPSLFDLTDFKDA